MLRMLSFPPRRPSLGRGRCCGPALCGRAALVVQGPRGGGGFPWAGVVSLHGDGEQTSAGGGSPAERERSRRRGFPELRCQKSASTVGAGEGPVFLQKLQLLSPLSDTGGEGLSPSWGLHPQLASAPPAPLRTASLDTLQGAMPVSCPCPVLGTPCTTRSRISYQK